MGAPTAIRTGIGNLPAETTSFVGRRRELGAVKRLLDKSRLVTLTGVGGTGKTRLALRAAAELRRAFAHGVWFVDLTHLHDAGLLAQTVGDPDALAFLVMSTLGLREQRAGPPVQVLVEQLADRQLLLILDNCEHLIPASAILAEALLRHCPWLRILATSRERLAIGGEAVFPVPPLSSPDPGRLPILDELSRYESVALFLARAEVALPGFGRTAVDHRVVAELCHRLDGLPLAIELAAARMLVLTPEQILDRLPDRFALLNQGSRLPQRQHTLRACVDWSFELCTKPERLLWARLSVFAHGFDLDAVQGVCADEQLPEAGLLDLVTALLNKSIMTRDDGRDHHAEAARYRMLDTIRDYGQDRLRATGEDAVLRRRHRDWHHQLVVRARAQWISDRQAYWLRRLAREHSNLRAAIEYSLTEPGEAQAALHTVLTLPFSYWTARGMVGEGRRWLDRAIAQYPAQTALRARALLLAGYFALLHDDVDIVGRLLDQAHDLAQQVGTLADLAFDAFVQAMGAAGRNDLPCATESCERGLAILARTPQPDVEIRLVLLATLGLLPDRQRANAANQEILTIAEPSGEGIIRSYALWALGLDAWRQGEFQAATRQVLNSLRIRAAQTPDDRHSIGLCLEVLAWIAASQRHFRRAATLLGAADALRAELGTPITAIPPLVGDHDACERQAHASLGDAAFTDALRYGQALTCEDAIAYALGERRPPAQATPEDAPSPLTPREQQVADLIAQGQSNKDIAGSLVISQRTAESHVQNILTKLGVTNRAQVAVWKATQQRDRCTQDSPASSRSGQQPGRRLIR